ncbi:MAG: FAD-dependent oxidoreductase [Chitinophagaceae bacterium]|nr:FAD-dependent oxidoreductase [Chitinophagaceae bacterium]
MKRRHFIQSLGVGSGYLMTIPNISSNTINRHSHSFPTNNGLSADLVIAGAGMGGCAAALAALRNGLRVVMTEETDWIGGQLTQQGLSCPDEHQWIEFTGSTQSYRDLRNAIRKYYVDHYPLTETARNNPILNPGAGAVSRLCHEPRVALSVLLDLFAPYISSGKLILLTEHKIINADINNDQVAGLNARSLQTGKEIILRAPYFIDATELGELLPLTKTEYVTGAESRQVTKELHAADKANPAHNQAFTFCFAMDYLPEENHVIDKPETYSFWKGLVPDLKPAWPGKLLSLSYSNPSTLEPKALGFDPTGKPTGQMLNLWNYRRIIDRNNFQPGYYQSDITIVNWPQNDYFLNNIIDVDEKTFQSAIKQGKQLSLSLLYWLQTEAPRPDGGFGWSGLRLRRDIMGTEDGLAKYPYIRESRRIKAIFTVLEEHVGKENRKIVAGEKAGVKAADFFDSVGIGYYHIDLHPDTGKNNYIDFASLPFQIPLGALLPQRVQNLIPANKNIGTTHITNGCYRLHPVEWSIGEAAGMLIAFSINKKTVPHAVRENKKLLEEFQQFIQSQGITTHWPADIG